MESVAESLLSILGTIWTIAKVAIGIGFVIFVHELGHYIAAKLCGVKVEKFLVGFDVPINIGPFKLPRTLWRKQWGETFYAEHCNCADSGWGWTVPVNAHPAGAGPFGTEQQAGNVWEWVADRGADGWGVVRGGSYLDTAWGLRTSRVQPADTERATNTTGFRIAIGGPWREQF